MEEQGLKTVLLRLFTSKVFVPPFLLLWTMVNITPPNISYSQWLWGFHEVRDVNILWKNVVLFQISEISMTNDISISKRMEF